MNQRPLASHLVTVFHLLVIVAICPSTGRSQDRDKQVEQNPELNLEQQQSMQEILQIRERLGGGLTRQLQGVLGDDTPQDFGESLKSVIQKPRQLDMRQPPPGQRWLNHPSGHSGLFPSRPISCWTGRPQVPLGMGDVVDIVEKTGQNEGKTILQSVEVYTVQRTPTYSDPQRIEDVRVQFWVDAQQNKLLDECPESTKLQVKKSSLARLPSSSLPGKPPVGEPDHRSAHLARFSPVRVQQLRQAARDLERIASDLEDLEMYDDADALRLKVQQLRSVARRKNGTTDIMQR